MLYVLALGQQPYGNTSQHQTFTVTADASQKQIYLPTDKVTLKNYRKPQPIMEQQQGTVISNLRCNFNLIYIIGVLERDRVQLIHRLLLSPE
jgi:hypothetical protein